MKKYLLIFALIALNGIHENVFAKKVKFSVNMSGQTLSPNGIHVWGDFQTIIGQGPDWTPGNTQLIKETTDTNIYSLVVDLPAFAKYEYKYLNGDQGYEVEVVPEESRANYNFSDNRWIYVDSLDNDTLDIGAVMFNGNAPAGLTLIRYKVDMQSYTESPLGIHVATNYQGWNAATDRMYSFSNHVYELIHYVNTGNIEYKFYNGNTSSDAETVPLTCANNGNRSVSLTADKVMDSWCFSSCNICIPLFTQNMFSEGIKISPNPSNGQLLLDVSTLTEEYHVNVWDCTGKTVAAWKDLKGPQNLSAHALQQGIYFITIQSAGKQYTQKWLLTH